ncbi:MAG: hypothetical protein ACOC8P_00470 [Dichotomicrobium sp.]
MNQSRPIGLFAAINTATASWLTLRLARIGGKLIKVGDSERKVVQADPDREVQLETSRGGAAGFRFDFYEHQKTVQVYVQGGKIVRICHVRE